MSFRPPLLACLLLTLGLGACELQLQLPGATGPGLCEAPEDAAAAWLSSSSQRDAESDAPLELEAGDDAPRRWVVHFEAPSGYAALAQGARSLDRLRRTSVEDVGGTVVRDLPQQNAVAAELDAAQVAALQARLEVRLVEEDARRFLLSQSVPSGITQVGAPEAWAQAGAVAAPGVKTCIIDSGLHAPHEDLPRTGVSGHPANWNTDSCGHGTHVAGTVAALDNGVGVVGVSPKGADLFVVKVFGDDCGWSYASELADAVMQCADAGAKVVNMSLGGRTPSEVERDAFEQAWQRGLLLVAAAGNSGTTELQYPASYPSVLSVGAVDGRNAVASFSQRNGQVDLTAPGVRVESTVGFSSRHEVALGSVRLRGSPIENAAATSGVNGVLVDGGRCEAAADWKGRVVACARGGNTFAAKVEQVRRAGGKAAVIYNHEAGPFQGTLGEARLDVPVVALPGADKAALLAAVGDLVTVVNEPSRPGSGYAAYSGTSMAAPHVAGVASFIWGQSPQAGNLAVRRALLQTARDLGPQGRDDLHGHGLVRADAALAQLRSGAGENLPPEPGFFARCEGLECLFYDTSFDAEGAVADFVYGVEGRQVRGLRKLRYAFAGPGPHRVTLQAEDAEGVRGDYTLELPVFELAAQGSGPRAQGGREVALRWRGSGESRVAVVRDDKLLGWAKNTGEWVDALPAGRAGDVRYRVCDESLSSCSAEVMVSPLCAG